MNDNRDYHTIMGCVCSAQDLMPLGECLLKECPIVKHMKEIINAITNELHKAEVKHPYWPADVVHQSAIVGEESGELIRAALNYRYEGGSIEELKKEAIQTAAMCIRFLKNIDSIKE